MGTKHHSPLVAALFGKTRRAVLALFYSRADESFYLRQVSRAANAGLGAVQRELMRLSAAGIILRVARGRQVFYQANRQCPIFSELQQLIVKTTGVVDVLRAALLPLGPRIEIAFLYGSFARGEQARSSDVDVFIVGQASFASVVSALGPAQKKLGREVNPSVFPRREFQSKVRAKDHFLMSVLEGPKILLIGEHDELARMAGQRLAPGA